VTADQPTQVIHSEEAKGAVDATVMESGWRLTVLSGTARGQSFVLGRQISIGRSDENDVVLDDPNVSRRHAVIQQKAGQYIIVDQGSSNGTFVDGVRITKPTRLQGGEQLSIGGIQLAVQSPFGAVRSADAQPTSLAAAQAPTPPPPPPPPPTAVAKGGVPGWVWLFGVGGLLAIALLAVLLFGGFQRLFGGGEEATPTVAVALFSSPTQAPTDTLEPSLTPTEEVIEPEPTATFTQTPLPSPTETATMPPPLPTATLPPPPTATSVPAMPTPDLEAKMREAKILLYEDMWQSRYVKQALDAMGLPYVDVVDRSGDFKAQLLSGTNWDLIITAIEARSVVQGEFFVYINENLNKGSSVIIEIWNLDDIWAGQFSTILTRCGVQFQSDWWDPPQRSVWWLASEHPVLHEPNDGISLVHYQEFWPGDAGDLLRKAPGGDAVMLAGIYATEKTSYATLVTCMDGRMIIQTHSTHDFRPTDIIPLWQNYIYNTLRARFLLFP
jgi:hypothetical protein